MLVLQFVTRHSSDVHCVTSLLPVYDLFFMCTYLIYLIAAWLFTRYLLDLPIEAVSHLMVSQL